MTEEKFQIRLYRQFERTCSDPASVFLAKADDGYFKHGRILEKAGPLYLKADQLYFKATVTLKKHGFD